MGKSSAPAPAPAAPQASVTPLSTTPDQPTENLGAARRLRDLGGESQSASTINAGGTDVDPLTQRSQSGGGQASMMG